MEKEQKQHVATLTAAKMMQDVNLLAQEDQSPDASREHEVQNLLSREKAINSFKLMAKKKPPTGQEFCVIGYFLTDVISPEGSRGMWFLVGTYPRADMAKKKAISLIEETGINSIYAMKTCEWQDINDKFEPNRIKVVPTGRDARLKEQHLKEYKQTTKEYKREREIAQEMDEEQERELHPDQIEYYTRQWYLAIRNQSTVKQLIQQLQEATDSMNLRIKNIRDVYQQHPEFEDQWLEILAKKLPKRGEDAILKSLQQGHTLMAPSVLSSSNNSNE